MIIYFLGIIITISLMNVILFNLIIRNQTILYEESSRCENDNVLYGIDCLNSINFTYIEYSSGGLGNRLLGAANVILLSIITHRYPKCIDFIINFIVKNWDEFDNYFTIPFSSFITHTSYTCTSIDICNMNIEYIKSLLESKDTYICFKEIWCDMSYFITNLNIYNSLLRQYHIIQTVFDDNIVNLSLEINYYLLNNVIQTKTKYNNQIEDIIRRNRNYNLIGMHIRTGYGDFNDRIYLNDENIQEFINQAKVFTSQYRNDSKWFIASDSSRIKSEIYRSYYSNVLTISNSPVMKVSHYNRNKSDESGLIDFLLLSKCNKLIITNQSTFGLVALFKSGICIKETNYDNCMKSIGDGVKTHRIKLFDGKIY